MANGLASVQPLLAQVRALRARVESEDARSDRAPDAIHAALEHWLTQHDEAREDELLEVYELLLASIAGNRRAHRGVYYTPPSVAGYVVRSVAGLVQDMRPNAITVIDPACGSGRFLLDATRVLPEITACIGYDLDPLPLRIAHHLLRGTDQVTLREANFLEAVARDQVGGVAFPVIIGNPPWSGISANMTPDVAHLVDAYKFIDGVPLGERKLWLQDDYVKFFRAAQMLVERAGRGIVAFVSNHAFLDNPTFRAMRASLLATFDRIDIVDLGGHAMRRSRRTRTERRDENVFNIQQGVAITFLVKHGTAPACHVRHCRVSGTRAAKLAWCDEYTLDTTALTPIAAASPLHLFVNAPGIVVASAPSKRTWSLPEIFHVYSAGIITARDRLVIDADRSRLIERLLRLRDASIPDEEIRATLFGRRRSRRYPPGDTRGWKLDDARRRLAAMTTRDIERAIRPCAYRPMDARWMFYEPGFVDWPRHKVNQHVLDRENLALVSVRQVAEGHFTHALVSRSLVESRLTISNKGTAFVFPLWLYGDPTSGPSRRSNLREEVRDAIGAQHTPQDILAFILATLSSPTYRAESRVALTYDWPKISLPEPQDDAWVAGVARGQALIAAFDRIPGPDAPLGDPVELADDDPVHAFELGGYPVIRKWRRSHGRDMDARRLDVVRSIQHLTEGETSQPPS